MIGAYFSGVLFTLGLTSCFENKNDTWLTAMLKITLCLLSWFWAGIIIGVYFTELVKKEL
jgi:hypothetical protein